MMTKAFPRQSCEITHLSQTSSLHLSPLIRSLWLYSSPQTLYSAANNVGFFPHSLLVAGLPRVALKTCDIAVLTERFLSRLLINASPPFTRGIRMRNVLVKRCMQTDV